MIDDAQAKAEMERQANRLAALNQLAVLEAKIAQHRANLERMEREGTTASPAFDANSVDNQGRTQYNIDALILADYIEQRNALLIANPDLFKEGA